MLHIVARVLHINYQVLLLLLSRFSRVRLCATPETAAHQAPPSMGLSRQEHWSGVPLPSPPSVSGMYYKSSADCARLVLSVLHTSLIYLILITIL